MGCCESQNIKTNEPDYSCIIKSIFNNNPIKSKSIECLLNLFDKCENKEDQIEDSRKTYSYKHKKSDYNRSYSEQKYINLMRYLFGLSSNFNEDSININSITRSTSSNTLIKVKSDTSKNRNYKKDSFIQANDLNLLKYNNSKKLNNKSNNLAKFNATNTKDKDILDKTSYKKKSSKSINNENYVQLLYYSVVIDFFNINKFYFSDSPKSNFILFIILFTNDSIEVKSRFLLQSIIEANLECNLINFQKLIKNYCLIVINMLISIYEYCNLNKHNELKEYLCNEFNISIRFYDLILEQWSESNNNLIKNKYLLADKFALLITKDLLNLIINNVNDSNFKMFVKKHRHELDNLSVIQLCDLILDYNSNACINSYNVINIINLHTYFFDAYELSKLLLLLK